MKEHPSLSTGPGRAALLTGSALFALLGISLLGTSAWASGHGDAPLAGQDPQTNIANVHAFVGLRYDDPSQQVLNVLVQVRPFSQAGGGIVFPRFADDALYTIHIADPATGETLVRYDFAFSDVDPQESLLDPDAILSYGQGTQLGAILSVGDAHQNYVQTYRVQRSEGSKGKKRTKLAEGLATPPPNVGLRTTPAYNDPITGRAVSGAATIVELDAYTAATIHSLPDGEVVFAGTRDDAFYGDLPGLFDLVDPRLFAPDGTGQTGTGTDAFAGHDALSYAIQIPLEGLANQVGVYASVDRGTRKLKKRGALVSKKPKAQVVRMGNPLLNLLLLPLRYKDEFHRSQPEDDAQFSDALLTPELARIVNLLHPGQSFPETGRSDLVSIFLPDVLRVDTTTGPVPLPGTAGFDRLSAFGGDTTGGLPSGWPNGRRPGDDVVDLVLTVLAGGTIVGDNVNANDQLYHQVFPYLATPHAGTNP